MTGWSFLALMAHASPAAELIERQDPPVVVAHRGASSLAPENTLAAIRKAAELGAVMVEFDVRQTKDGRVVLMHDADVRRTTDGKGRIKDTTHAQLTELDAGHWFGPAFQGEPVPTLDEALAALGPKMVAAIELKSGRAIVPKVHAAIDRHGLAGRVVIFSFRATHVRASKAVRPTVPALFLIDPERGKSAYTADVVSRAQTTDADLVGLNHLAVDANTVRAFHEAGMPVFVYTVDNHPDVERMMSLGVDGIISNKPRATRSRIARFVRESAKHADTQKQADRE
jgi:glycerophosphoryl diester phosphodiesterase